jgi:hypothetical protein
MGRKIMVRFLARAEIVFFRTQYLFPNLHVPLAHSSEVASEPWSWSYVDALDRVQNKAAKFAHHRNDSNWETLTQRRKVSRICALCKAYTAEQTWKAIGDRLDKPCYLSRDDHNREIRSRKQKTNIGKYFFVNRTIQLWNQLPADVLGTLL